MGNPYSSSRQLRKDIAARSGGACLLSFSCGKDSIVAWEALREQFHTVRPFFFYLIPGLSFVEESLRYFEDRYQQPILRLPHPSLYRMLRFYVFQPPERWPVIQDADLPNWTYEQAEARARAHYGLPDAYVATGTRPVDSPLRMGALRKHGPINAGRRLFWSVYDWKIRHVLDCLERRRIRLPVDYAMWGRSFDGVDYRFLKPLKERYPADYAKVLEWFPLADAELFRREAAKHSIDDDPAWSRAFSPDWTP